MLDVTVKTLDGKNRSFSVPDDITVKQFKEKIAGSIEIGVDLQRLIFQGRVLQDEKNLNHYDVNGKTLHVVQRAPPSSRPPTSSAPEGSTSSSSTTQPGSGETRTFVGSFTLPSDVVDPNQVQNIVQNVLSGMGDVGRNASISTSSSNDGSSVDVHINLGQIGPGAAVQSESQNRIRIAQRMICRARHMLDRLENPPSGDADDSDAMEVTPGDEASPPRETGSPVDPMPESVPTMDTSTASTSAGTSADATPSTSTAGSSTQDATAQTAPTRTEGSTQTGGSTPPEGAPRGPQNPHTPVLADLLTEVFEINRRLQPHMERYQQLMRDDPSYENNMAEAQAAQRVCNGVSAVMHYVSHAYHSISDLMVDTRQAPPRMLRSHPVAHPAAIIQQTIPIQAQINVAHISPGGSPQLPRRSAAPGTGTTTSSAASSTANTPTSTARPQQAQPNIRMGMPFRFGMPPGMAAGMAPGMPAGVPPPGGAFGTAGQPFMFMELGPQGLHINSISAQVVSGTNTNATNTTGTSSSTGSRTTPTTGGATTPSSTPRAPPPSMGAPGGPGFGAPGGPGFGAPGGPGFGAPGGLGFQLPPGMFGMPPPPGQGAGGQPQQFMPPNFLQNILQMATGAGQAAGPHQVIVLTQGMPMPGAAGSIPTTAGSRATTVTSSATGPATSSTTTSSTTTTQPGPTPQAVPNQPGGPGARPRGVAFAIPGPPHPPGFLPPGVRLGADPYLPCQSRFFLRSRMAAGMPPGGSNGQPAEGQADQGLAGMVSDIVSSMMNQAPGMDAPPPGQSPAQSNTAQSEATSVPTAGLANPFAALFTQPGGAVPGAVPQGPPRPGTTQPPAIEQLRNLLQSGRASSASSQPQTTTTSSSQSSSTTSTSSQSGSRQSPMGDEMFAQLVGGIGNYISQAAMGQQASDSIHDFVNALGQDFGGPNEGLLGDIFSVVSRHMTIVDLMSVFCHQTAPLQRLVLPLQDFVRDRILQGEEATEDNIDDSIGRLIEEMLPQIEEICTEAPVRDNIDFPASVQELMRCHLKQNTNLILQAGENDAAFGESLYTNIQQLIHEFLVLSRCCLEGGPAAVERLVQTNVQRISSDINPLIQQWMSSMTLQQVQGTTRNIRVTEEQVQGYIVRRAEMDASPQSQSSDASFMSAESGDKEPIVDGAMATEVPTCLCNDSSKETEAMDIDEEKIPSPTRSRDVPVPMIPPSLLRRMPPPPRAPVDIPVVNGSEEWHSQVPPEWVSVISQDGHRQQNIPRQAPFSDAYINGMPPKRRKLMHSSDEATELADIRTLLPQAISRAAEAAGAQSITSQEDMEKDAAGSTTLREAFQQEMDDSIRKRIHEDSEYIPEKYPNAEKYFKDKK